MPAFSSYLWILGLTPGSKSEGRPGPWKSNSGFFFKPWYCALKNTQWDVPIGVLDLFYASFLLVQSDSPSDAWFKSCDAFWALSTRFWAFFHCSSTGSRPIRKRRARRDSTQNFAHFIHTNHQDPTNINSGDRGGWDCGGCGILRDIVAGAVELIVTALVG